MDVSKITTFAMMQQRMRYLSERQAIIAQNIANADTPGYVPQDLKPLDFKAMVGNSHGGLAPRATHPAHMNLVGAHGSFYVQDQKDTYEISPTGNAVVLEEQALRLSATQLDYQATTSMYRKYMDMLRLAAGSASN